MTTALDQRAPRSWRRRPVIGAAAVAALTVSGLGLAPVHAATVTRDRALEQLVVDDAGVAGATAGSPAYLRLYEERAAMAETVSLIDEEALMEAAFHGATSGSPAQVRALDTADLLQASISTSTIPSP